MGGVLVWLHYKSAVYIEYSADKFALGGVQVPPLEYPPTLDKASSHKNREA